MRKDVRMGGQFVNCPLTSKMLAVIAEIHDDGTEHVSVSLKDRDPLWKEMCYIKDMFWDDEDTVVQIHPKKSEYVNVHEHCLHLWKLEL